MNETKKACACGGEGRYRCGQCGAGVCRVCVIMPYPGGVRCAACGTGLPPYIREVTPTMWGDRTGD